MEGPYRPDDCCSARAEANSVAAWRRRCSWWYLGGGDTYWRSLLICQLAPWQYKTKLTRRQLPHPGRSSHITPIVQNIVLLTARQRTMDPSPHTVTPSRRTWRQICRDLKLDVLEPGAGVVGTDNRKVFRLEGEWVRLVRDRQPAALDVLELTNGRVPLVVRVHRADTADVWVVSLAGVDPVALLRGTAESGERLVACDLAVVRAAGREVHHLAGSGRAVDIAVEPPG